MPVLPGPRGDVPERLLAGGEEQARGGEVALPDDGEPGHRHQEHEDDGDVEAEGDAPGGARRRRPLALAGLPLPVHAAPPAERSGPPSRQV